MKVSRRGLSLSLTVCLAALGFGSPAHELRASTFNINLQAQSGHYLVAENGGGDLVYANRTAAGPWETFELNDGNGGALDTGDPVFFVTYSGYYLRADGCGGGALLAVGTVPFSDTCEIFFVYKVDNANNIIWGPISNGDQIAIKTSNGHWLVAEGGGGSWVNADRTGIGPWERFFITM
jgi:hypothetical protein